MQIIPANPTHLKAITAIYADAVLRGTGTFEEIAPTQAEMTARFEAILGAGYAWLVAVDHAEVLGYGYYGPFRARSAYRFTVEDSLYVAQNSRGKGVGGALLSALIARAAEQNMRQVLALIGDSTNTASIALHRAQGFEMAGRMRDVGYKFERWLDVVVMQLTLNNSNEMDRK